MLLSLLACDPRPDEAPAEFALGGDTLQFVDGDGGLVRVHYTEVGINAVDPEDDDEDGVPDRPVELAREAESFLAWYAEEGFEPPPPEEEFGVEAGGSGALDVYLLDMSGWDYDGINRHGACEGPRCSTWIMMSNMEDSGGESTVAHELFHSVQAAYDYHEAGWLDEGSARWAASRADHRSDSFGWEWLQNHTCGLASIDRDGRCETAMYSTSRIWKYMDASFGPQVLLHTWEATPDTDDSIDALDEALRLEGTSLRAEWPLLMAYNLATGPRAPPGSTDEVVVGLHADAQGPTLHVTANIEPLSARYYRVDHPGGELWAGVAGDATHLRISVHRVEDGNADGLLDEMVGPYGLPANGDLDLGTYDAGGIWLVVSNPELHGFSTPVDLCFDHEPCQPGCAGLSFAPLLLTGAGLGRALRGRSRRCSADTCPPRR